MNMRYIEPNINCNLEKKNNELIWDNGTDHVNLEDNDECVQAGEGISIKEKGSNICQLVCFYENL